MKNYVGLINIERNKDWKTLLVTEGSDNIPEIEKLLEEWKIPVKYEKIEEYGALDVMKVWTIDIVLIELVKELIRRNLMSLEG